MDDCHWKKRPPLAEVPERLSVNTVVAPPDVGLIAVVPVVGAEEQFVALPLPATATFTVLASPPPVIVTLPL